MVNVLHGYEVQSCELQCLWGACTVIKVLVGEDPSLKGACRLKGHHQVAVHG